MARAALQLGAASRCLSVVTAGHGEEASKAE